MAPRVRLPDNVKTHRYAEHAAAARPGESFDMREQKPILSRLSDERGQVIVFVVIAFVVLTAMVGVVIDVGYAYRTQRNLQATADAAALAGAQQLPDPVSATSVATQYGASSSGNNKVGNNVPVT